MFLAVYIILNHWHHCHFPVAFNSCQTIETWKLMFPPHADVFLITISGLCEKFCATTLLHLRIFFPSFHWFFHIRSIYMPLVLHLQVYGLLVQILSLSKRSESIDSFHFRPFIILCTLFKDGLWSSFSSTATLHA